MFLVGCGLAVFLSGVAAGRAWGSWACDGCGSADCVCWVFTPEEDDDVV